MTTCCKCILAILGIVAALGVGLLFTFCPWIRQQWMTHWPIVAGLSVTLSLSLLIGCLLNTIRRGKSNDPLIGKLWEAYEDRKKLGNVIGPLESSIFFAAWLVPPAWALGAGWLAFKAVLYWQGTTYTHLPNEPLKEISDQQYVVDRHTLGAYHSGRVIVGTAASIVAGLAGAAVAYFLRLQAVNL